MEEVFHALLVLHASDDLVERFPPVVQQCLHRLLESIDLVMFQVHLHQQLFLFVQLLHHALFNFEHVEQILFLFPLRQSARCHQILLEVDLRTRERLLIRGQRSVSHRVLFHFKTGFFRDSVF